MNRVVPMKPISVPPIFHPQPASAETDPPELDGLYEHGLRPHWGLAACIDRGDRYASYQFEDGSLRKIAHSHAHLMVEVDKPRDESERLQQRLAAKAGLTLARRKQQEEGGELITLDQQVELFLTDFEEGFDDPGYVKKHRGGSGRRVKRHRGPAIAQAQESLSEEQMSALIDSYRPDLVIERVIELLRATSLVTKPQLAPLEALPDSGMHRAAHALRDLLYGETEPSKAMQAWIDALSNRDKSPSWSLVTAVPALVKPREHLCVRRTVIAQQARWMAPRLQVGKTPSGKVYSRLRKMALRVQAELAERDLETRDLLDVYDFVWLTLRPAACKHIAATPRLPEVSHERLVGDGDQANELDTADTHAA